MRLVQFERDGRRHVAAVEDGNLRRIEGFDGTYALAAAAIDAGQTIEALARRHLGREAGSFEAVIGNGRLLPPLLHPDPAHCLVTGTGLTHLGSAGARDKMHAKIAAGEETLTDSMKMFKMGLEGGKPAGGEPGVQPEWFYKGDGSCIVAPGEPLEVPASGLDGGEEPEITGVYLIGPDGTPWRVGFAIGNEFSDHVMERQNYLYLAHSKLRGCSFGPELLLGDPPEDIRGMSRILRGGRTLWEKEFLSGEANMSHWIRGLEYHHFKYRLFRRPGDVHIHFFGTATLSVADGITTEPGDIFEIDCPAFGRPLRNPLATAAKEEVTVRVL
jgi:hypothetical protein